MYCYNNRDKAAQQPRLNLIPPNHPPHGLLIHENSPYWSLMSKMLGSVAVRYRGGGRMTLDRGWGKGGLLVQVQMTRRVVSLWESGGATQKTARIGPLSLPRPAHRLPPADQSHLRLFPPQENVPSFQAQNEVT